MRDGGRLSAAIAVLDEMQSRHKPARMALKNWGESARYAGSGDRAFVAGLVLDALRKRRSNGWKMQDDSARAACLAVLRFGWDWPLDKIAAAAGDEAHGPGCLSDAEIGLLAVPCADPMPSAIAGDYPDWLDASLERVFGDGRALEGQALSTRAPVDLRVNRLKADAAKATKALAMLGAEPVDGFAEAFRIPPPQASQRTPPVEASPAFGKGWFEVQDLGSQIAASCAGDIKGKQVLDYCAGGGGKTLALAAMMGNSGQIYAHDIDARRMADLVPRATRAGVRNLQVRSPLSPENLDELKGRMDLVFVDAPCTGSGTWRRHPDAKWRLALEQLAERIAEQDAVLAQAAAYVKPGGRMVYVTCSVLAEENEDRISAFLALHAGFAISSATISGLDRFQTPEGFLRLTPSSAGTDGFFVAVMERKA